MTHRLALPLWILMALMLSQSISAASPKPKNLYKRWKNGPSNDLGYFPIGVSTQRPNLAGSFKAIGVNMYVRLWAGPTEAQLSDLKRHGMETACPQNAVGFAHAKLGKDSLIKMWHMGDEPDNAQSVKRYWSKRTDKQLQSSWPGLENRTIKSFGNWGPPVPPKWKIAEYKEWVKRDPTRPVRLNFGYGVAYTDFKGRGIRARKLEDYKEYVKAGDIVSFDIYPVNEASYRDKFFLQAVGIHRLRKWTNDKKPVWNYIESCQISTRGRKPTFDEMRSQIWISLIAGCDGIVYFCHGNNPSNGRFWDRKLQSDKAQMQVVGRLNREILSVAPALNHEDIKGAIEVASSVPASSELKRHDLDPITCVAKFDGRDRYIFAARMEKSPASATFTLLKGPKDGSIEVLNENRTLRIKNGKFTDKFDAHGVHLYKIVR